MAVSTVRRAASPWSLAALRPLDRWLVVLLVPVWLASFILHAHVAANGLLSASAFFVADAPAPTAYPTISSIMPGSEAVVDSAGLQVGDELMKVGAEDLRGLTGLKAGMIAFSERRVGITPSLEIRREGVVRTITMPVAELPVPWWWPMLFSFSFAVVGYLIILRAPKSPAAQAIFPAFMAWALSWLPYPAESMWKVAATLLTFGISMLFAGPMLLRAAMLLLDAPRRRWVLNLPWVFAVMAPMAVSAFVGFPVPAEIATRMHPLLQVAVYVALLGILADNYRRANSVGRRQVRWVMLGFYFALAPAAVVTAFVAVFPDAFILYTVSGLGLPLIPVSFLIAIVKYNLFDVNRLISAAASYSVLSVVVLGGMFFLIPQLAEMSAQSMQINPLVAQSLLSMGLAMTGIPLHRRLQPAMDRIFFPERHAIEKGVQTLTAELPACNTPEDVLTLGGKQLSAAGAEPFAIFGSVDGAFTTVYATGRGIPLALDTSTHFGEVLQRRNRALEIAEWLRTPEIANGLTAADRATLDAMGDGVLLPVRGQGALAALIFLGPKASGDIYTSQELTLLTAAAQQISSELQRFASAELLEQSRTMQRTMRRYVPGAIAKQIDSGADLEEGQREVTVLFVDIRGYTSIAEGMAPADIFATVNRHTARVSDIVQENGGTIVEFNGDGMMTVFGAPIALAHKEAAAVRTARQIVEANRATTAGDPGAPTAAAIQVGVGIATGEAYVGNVKSVDRYIWTALGNTTNLAARLQALSRDLQAAIVIDDVTAQRAAGETAGFVARGPTVIRGRSEPVSVHTLST